MKTINGVNYFGYVETSNLKATVAGHIFDVVMNTGLENGMALKLGDLTSANEIHDAALPAVTDEIVLVANEALIYDESTRKAQEEWFYSIPAGEVARCYEVAKYDRFSVLDYSITALADKVVVGNYIVVDPVTGFYKEVAKSGFDADDYGFAARIFAIEPRMIGSTSNATLVRVEVIKNETVSA